MVVFDAEAVQSSDYKVKRIANFLGSPTYMGDED